MTCTNPGSETFSPRADKRCQKKVGELLPHDANALVFFLAAANENRRRAKKEHFLSILLQKYTKVYIFVGRYRLVSQKEEIFLELFKNEFLFSLLFSGLRVLVEI